jgi:hypothetical protein
MTKDQATSETGSLRLKGASGGYDKTLPIASNYQENAGHDTGDVEFPGVPTKDRYSLSYIGSDGSESFIVQDTPFDNLKDNSPGTS